MHISLPVKTNSWLFLSYEFKSLWLKIFLCKVWIHTRITLLTVVITIAICYVCRLGLTWQISSHSLPLCFHVFRHSWIEYSKQYLLCFYCYQYRYECRVYNNFDFWLSASTDITIIGSTLVALQIVFMFCSTFFIDTQIFTLDLNLRHQFYWFSKLHFPWMHSSGRFNVKVCWILFDVHSIAKNLSDYLCNVICGVSYFLY